MPLTTRGKPVTYTWQEIEQEWLGGGLATTPDEVLTAFNEVASRFGREWVEATRTRNGIASRGASPTLYIVTLARLLHALDGAPNSAALIEKVRRGNLDARAELIAIYLLRSGHTSKSRIQAVQKPRQTFVEVWSGLPGSCTIALGALHSKSSLSVSRRKQR